jgi:hypothetical protein
MLLLFCTGYPLALALLAQGAKNRAPADTEVKMAGGLQQWRVQRDLDLLGFLYNDLKRDHAYYRPACLFINFISGLLYVTVYDPVVRLCVLALVFYVHLVYITVTKPFKQEREAYAVTALLVLSFVSMTVVVGVRAFEGASHTSASVDTWHLAHTRQADRNAALFSTLIFLLLAFLGEHSILSFPILYPFLSIPTILCLHTHTYIAHTQMLLNLNDNKIPNIWLPFRGASGTQNSTRIISVATVQDRIRRHSDTFVDGVPEDNNAPAVGNCRQHPV